MDKKILILLPDGVGLRNFAYTNFHQLATKEGFDITFWNDTPFDLKGMGFKEIKIKNSKAHAVSNLLKRARVQIDLNQNIRKSNDRVYDSYRFAFSKENIKEHLRTFLVRTIVRFYDSKTGILKVRNKIKQLEKTTDFYKQCIQTLKAERPDLVFCTNQRTMLSIAPILAAKELGIPTATFIFSWDNLPKATLAIEPDYYFVWSDFMKKELLFYYKYINESQIFVTGTPQFETHQLQDIVVSRESFFETYGLDSAKKYICYSGDDITTSPNDPQYLTDAAEAIIKLNENGHNLGLVFRRCPVDFSYRYDAVLEKYKGLIVPVNPKWERLGDVWNSILPTKSDLVLQMNTIAHTEMVINLGSSMVFDYVSFGKPCAYINYDVTNSIQKDWSVKTIYNFVHFRSMPNKKAVIWLNSPDEIASKIQNVLQNDDETIAAAQDWFKIINQHPVADASSRILRSFQTIINKSL